MKATAVGSNLRSIVLAMRGHNRDGLKLPGIVYGLLTNIATFSCRMAISRWITFSKVHRRCLPSQEYKNIRDTPSIKVMHFTKHNWLF